MKEPKEEPALRSLRERAARVLDERMGQWGKSIPGDVRELVHELGVHQVELEIQNEELRRTQLELEAVRDRYHHLYEFAPVGYLTLEYGTTVREANLAICQLLGIERRWLVGQTVSRMLTTSDREVLFAHRDRVLRTGEGSCEVTLHPPGIPEIVVRLQSNADASSGSEPRWWRTAVVDLTALREAEREVRRLNRQLAERIDAQAVALRFQEEEFRVLVDNVPASFSLVGPDQRYRFVNQRYAALFGEHPAAFVGRHMHDILGDHYEKARVQIDGALRGQLMRYEASFSRQGRDPRTMTVTYVPNFDSVGGPNGFFSIMMDVTDRRAAERALAESEKQLSAVLRTVTDAIVTFDESGRIVSANRAAERMFGYEHPDLLSREMAEFVPGVEPTREDGEEGPEPTGQTVETMARHASGRMLPVELTVNTVDYLGLRVAIVRDISERKEMESHLAEIASQERQSLAQELHDDLAGQLSGIELLADTVKRRLTRDNSPHAVTMAELTGHISECRSRMRTVARGLLPVEVFEHGLQEALEELAARTEETSGVKCAAVAEPTCSVSDVTVATHLYRIAQEAVTNAVRHGHPKSVWIYLRKAPGGIELSVVDDGVGLDDAQTAAGAGLRTMQYRSRSIGARLELRGERGEGTTVRCLLPQGRLHGPAVAPA